MAKDDKRAIAKDLYITGNYTQERIAQCIGINNATLTKWKIQDGWEEERDHLQRLTTSSETYIRELIDYNLLILQSKVRDNKRQFADGQLAAKDMKLIDGKETDALAKLFAQIKRKELTIADTVAILNRFLEFLHGHCKELAQTITPLSDGFIQETIKKQR